jgi:hypothetical protein
LLCHYAFWFENAGATYQRCMKKCLHN